MKSLFCFLACIIPLIANAYNPKGVVDGNNQFAFKLFGELKGSTNNIFYSPFSISTALAMTYAGAHGEAETQIRNI